MNIKSIFNIPDAMNQNIPMVDSHYYNFLKSIKPNDIHAVNTKILYLSSINWSMEYNFIPNFQLDMLSAIEKQYFYNEIVPTLTHLNTIK